MSQVLRNQELYVQELNNSASTRYELNEIHWKEMNNALKLFDLAFDKNRKDLVTTKNMLYYKGGYPSETTPPRLWSVVNQLHTILMYFTYIDKMDEINPYFEEFGIKVELKTNEFYEQLDIPIEELDKKTINKIKNIYNKLFHPEEEDEILKLTKKQLFKKILEFTLQKQSVICSLADTIKIEAAEKVEEECDIKKPSFQKAVFLKYKDLKNGDITEDIAKIEAAVDNIEVAISVLKD